MQFSMIFEAQMADPSPASERQVIRDCVEQAVFAEEMGFDRVWAVEHHCLQLVRAHERARDLPHIILAQRGLPRRERQPAQRAPLARDHRRLR